MRHDVLDSIAAQSLMVSVNEYGVVGLLTPRPPTMMVLNEPETSLHPDLLPALSKLILKAVENTQVWVVTHSPALIASLLKHSDARLIELQKDFGQTQLKGQNLLDRPQWRWVERTPHMH